MSTVAVASGGGGRSRLDPNAPLFIPAAIQQVEDFSPEWWELVKTTSWFRDHWFRQNQEQETFDGEDDDVVNLLPDSFDVSIADEFSSLEAELDAAYYQSVEAKYGSSAGTGQESDTEAVMRSLSLRSPKNGFDRHKSLLSLSTI